MVPVGESYRPTGRFDAQSVLVTLILGTTTAMIGAALVWLWEISPVPTLVLLTPIIQGLIVGAALAYMVGRLRMRNPALVGTIGFACGLLSIVLVHYGHHLRIVSMMADEVRSAIAANQGEGAKQKELLARLDADPAAVVDPFLKMQTGHSGLLGTMALRNQHGVTIKRMKVTGWALWGLWAAEALLVAFVTSALASARAAHPFCEDCGYWCAKEPDVFSIPGGQAAALAEAIAQEDAARVQELRGGPEADDGTGRAGVTLHACPQCDQVFADAWQQVQKGKETKTTVLLKNLRVSPELADALRHPPEPLEETPLVQEEPTEGPDPAPVAG